ncbi:unnamed protein product [Phytophthora fragariaefolia]|uniref:Unnamed protein product n=1 Tax=Phytophthora fragariaefolia TaxID=1490495 RepID=A0A9W6XRL6_9STRA|nr:unnamed protein product [Phytophthora fragariaefolia]
MGAALTSHDLSDPQHQALLSEYINHSRKTADECAHIFRGSLGLYDDEQNDPPSSSLGTRKPAYPRHIQLSQFEEVFGMLVADPEPHFQFFHHGKIVAADSKPKDEATVCAHRVFCAVALLMRADLHSKVDFVLRLYADIAGVLSPEAKSSLLKDFVTSVEEVLQLTDAISGSVLTRVEPGTLMTVLELYDVCLTNPQISGMLHGIHALIEGKMDLLALNVPLHGSNAQSQQSLARYGIDGSASRIKSMARTMSSATLTRAAFLWDLKVKLSCNVSISDDVYLTAIMHKQAGDYGSFWSQPELLQIPSNETCAHALKTMALADSQSALIIECTASAQPDISHSLGLISTDKMLL